MVFLVIGNNTVLLLALLALLALLLLLVQFLPPLPLVPLLLEVNSWLGYEFDVTRGAPNRGVRLGSQDT